jgi:hypothetical protein
MRSFFSRLWKSNIENPTSQAEQDLKNTCAGRIVSALTFIIVIGCLGVWIAIFLLVMDHLSMQTLPGKVLSNLNCIVFFGGLVLALFVGALAGNFLRRAFWKWLVRRRGG